MSEQMTEFQQNLVRMWDSMREDDKGTNTCSYVSCEDCLLNAECCVYNRGKMIFNAEKTIELVNTWAKEHPIVTYEQKYEETFGVKPVDTTSENKSLACPKDIGFGIDINCSAQSCEKCTEKFWGSEYREPKKGQTDGRSN